MTILKKDTTKDGKVFFTFIDKEFKLTKSGNGVIIYAAFHFPKAFVQMSKSGNKFVNVNADKLIENICISQNKEK
ncbi:MAG: hypothetical protein LBF00_02220 [Mycoplasmataceae bacterium]|jgi:hypothetical protein|nr:hypothetical protein [Mycoplasmataceae bacterium]